MAERLCYKTVFDFISIQKQLHARVNMATEYINLIFTMVFVVEAIIKIIGLRWHYFRRAWNVFDFVVVALSVLGKFLWLDCDAVAIQLTTAITILYRCSLLILRSISYPVLNSKSRHDLSHLHISCDNWYQELSCYIPVRYCIILQLSIWRRKSK